MRGAGWLAVSFVVAAGCASAPRAMPRIESTGGDGPAPAAAPECDEHDGGAVSPLPRNDGPFDAFARPVTNLDFHHPFIWNELRPVYAYHWIPDKSALSGGFIRIVACQLNLALTEDIGLTAYKDGYVKFHSGALPEEQGLADLAAGLKYKVYEDRSRMFMGTLGLGYEDNHVGDEDVLEGQGRGIFDVFGSFAKGYDKLHLIGTAGLKLPRASSQDNRSFHWHLHADYEVCKQFSPLLEVNGMHYMETAHRDAGLGAPLGFEGFDYTNLGAQNVDQNNVITAAIGFRWKLTDDLSLGAAYERPMTDRKDVFQDRITLDFTIRF